MKETVVDYESFFDKKQGISVVSQGVPNYVKAADAYIVSIVDDEFQFCGTIKQAQQTFNDSFWQEKDRQFFAANSNFDFGWHGKYFAPTHNDWQCVLDIGVGNQLPRDLANLTRVVLGAKMDKTIRDGMDGIRWEDLDDQKQQEMVEYCLNDSIQSKELLRALPRLSPTEARIAAHTRLVNRRGVYIDTERVERDKTMLHKIWHTAFVKLPWHKDCPSGEGALSAQRLAKWCNSKGLPVPKSLDKRDEECADIMSDNPEVGYVIEQMRKLRTANTVLKKAESLQDRLTDDGRLPLDLLYCGAPHTRRWSSQGFNVQNLAKEPFFGEIVLDETGKPDMEKSEWVWIRNWLIPKPGKKFLIFDLSQIEPRCLNWLAGNDEFLDMVRAGFGLYEAFAVAFKGWIGKPGTLKKVNPKLYAACKSEVLGLGFGMGGLRYHKEAAKSGIIMTEQEAIAAVESFRRDNPKIPALWRMLDSKLKQAILSQDKTLSIAMPNGESLRHYHLRQATKISDNGEMRASYQSSKMRGIFDERGIVRNLWGGTLTENVTQRMARDIFAEAQLRLEDAGFLVRFGAHDEAVLEVDDGNEKFLADQKAEVHRLMTITPDWAEGVPLAAEGDYCTEYCK